MRVTLIDLWAREGMLHYVSQLANGLARIPGVGVTILLPRGSDTDLFAASVAVDRVDVVEDNTARELLLAPLKLLKVPQFLASIRRTEPDVIHLNNCHVWYVFTLPWLRRRYPIVSTLHDVEPHPGLDDSWRKRREIDTLAHLSDRIFVHGEQLRQRLLGKYPSLSQSHVTAIPLGELSLFTRYPTDAEEEPETVLFFGRIRAYKGLQYLIDAARLVTQEMPRARFLIAGAGDLQSYDGLVGGEVDFEIHNRYIPEDQVAEFFRRASIVVLPYVEASQSAVIPIAYAFKKPVVTTRAGALPDVVEDGRTGFMVPARDAPALARAMLRLLEDGELRKTLGRNGYRKMENELGWDRIAATTLRVYKAAMRDRGKDPV